jgi:hypothetical protein
MITFLFAFSILSKFTSSKIDVSMSFLLLFNLIKAIDLSFIIFGSSVDSNSVA